MLLLLSMLVIPTLAGGFDAYNAYFQGERVSVYWPVDIWFLLAVAGIAAWLSLDSARAGSLESVGAPAPDTASPIRIWYLGLAELLPEPLRTQVWFEWKNVMGRQFRTTIVLLGLLFLASGPVLWWFLEASGVSVFVGVAENLYREMVVPTAGVIAGVVAFVVGYHALRFRTAALGFEAVRPMSTTTMVHAKLLAGLLASCGSALAVVIACVALLALGCAIAGDITPWRVVLRFVVMLPLLFVVAAATVWVSLFMGRLLLVVWGVASTLALPLMWTGPNAPEVVTVVLLASLPPLIALVLFGTALYRGAVKWQTISLVILFGGAAWLLGTWVMPPSSDVVGDMSHALLWGLALIVAPFAWVPLVMQWQRNR
jgi:hypothetical protein